MKNREIVAAYENLTALINKQEKYPVRFSYAVTRNFKMLESLMKDFESERNKLLDQYNVKNDKGEPAYKETGKVEIASEQMEAWTMDMGELLEIEVECNLQVVSIGDFPENIEPGILYGLDFMIQE